MILSDATQLIQNIPGGLKMHEWLPIDCDSQFCSISFDCYRKLDKFSFFFSLNQTLYSWDLIDKVIRKYKIKAFLLENAFAENIFQQMLLKLIVLAILL